MSTFTVWQFVGKRRENYAFGVCMFFHGDIDADSIAEDYLETRGRRYGRAVGKTAITWAA